MSRWLGLLRPGDWLVAGGGLLLALAMWPFRPQGQAETLLIRANGAIYRQVSLQRDQLIHVPGPLGVTVVRVAAGRARVESDPGPRQICVHQGWLDRPGQMAVCLPNRTSIELTGSALAFDSLSY